MTSTGSVAAVATPGAPTARAPRVMTTASDPDLPLDTLTFSLEGTVPRGAVIDPVTGAFSWVPTEDQGPATYTLAVRVSDAGIAGPVLSDTALFTVTVFEDGNMDTGPLADDGQPDTYRLRLNGDNIEALLNGTLVFVSPFDDAPQLTITGSTDSDTLIVDLSGGSPIPDEGIVFNGGGPADSDTLIVTGGSADTVTHTFTAADAGMVRTDEEIIAMGGTGREGGGSDTAVVLQPNNAHRLFDIKIKEILCKPRL